jgi:hypothetical protein
MKRKFLVMLLGLASLSSWGVEPAYDDIDEPPHLYRQSAPRDRFTRFKSEVESGKVTLDQSSEKGFLTSLLKELDIPASSQMLLFSTTSLQLGLITPSNPRALYFNDEIYLGFIPGGRIEIISVDPDLGAIFYIFDIPKDGRPLRPERSERCMNCHASEDTGFVPGLVVKSVVPGPGGGSLTAYRTAQTGHGIPLEQRFGGWYLTGQRDFTNHWGNLTGRLTAQGMIKNPIEPGKLFRYDRYPVASSDLLPQLLHEHQAGFVNRVVEATYRARTYLHAGKGQLNTEQAVELDRQAEIITRYLLFADEAALPAGGVEGDPAFKEDFQRHRRATAAGASLKDLDLRTRLLKHRCSYMIYTSSFTGLPPVMKERVHRRLAAALHVEKPDPQFAYLPATEKRAIRGILQETLAGLPAGW